MKHEYDKPIGPLIKKVFFGIQDYNLTLIIYTFAVGLLSLATPITVQSLVNTFSLSTDIKPLINLSFMLLILLVVFGILKSFQYITVELLQQKVIAQLSASVAKRVILGPRKSFQSDNIREKVNRFFEIIAIQKAIAMFVTDGLSIAIQTIIGLILLSLYHPFFIPFNILFGSIVIIVFRHYNSVAKVTAIKESSAKFEVAGFLQDVATTESRIQNEHISLKLLNHADSLILNYLNKRRLHFKIVFSETIIFLILYAIINAALLGLGGYLIIIGQLSVGQLVAAEIIVNSISIQLADSMKHLQLFYDLYASCDKLSWLLDLREVTIKDSRMLKANIDLNSSVSFDLQDVNLGFDKKLKLDIKIQPSSYHLFRFNDSRIKDQLVGFLLKNEDLIDGDIRVQDFSFKDLLSLEVRNLVHNIDEPIVFDGSVRQNLLDFENSETESHLYEVLKRFDLNETVFSLPNKLDQSLHAATSLLSYSQKYRLNLARVYLHKPKLLMIQVGNQLFSDEYFQLYLEEFRKEGCAILCFVHDESLDSIFKIESI
jgi:putative ABC transport system ATP-binding protein